MVNPPPTVVSPLTVLLMCSSVESDKAPLQVPVFFRSLDAGDAGRSSSLFAGRMVISFAFVPLLCFSFAFVDILFMLVLIALSALVTALLIDASLLGCFVSFLAMCVCVMAAAVLTISSAMSSIPRSLAFLILDSSPFDCPKKVCRVFHRREVQCHRHFWLVASC